MTEKPGVGRSERSRRILAAAESAPHMTEHFSLAARCSLAEATVELLRLEQDGLIRRGLHAGGMTWRAT